MTNVTISEDFQPYKHLIIRRKDEDETISTTRIVISDESLNSIRVVNVEQGPVGEAGPVGPQGPAGIDAPTFSVLPLSSGGTNNTTFSSGNIIYYDGTRLSSASYSIQDILNQTASNNSVTGVLAGSGLTKIDSNNTVTLNTVLGEGLEIGNNNEIVVDGTIARVSELDLGTIQGQVPISKGGTNNNFYTQNRLLYYDGIKIKSFPMETGNFLFNGVSIDIVAGSGLVGGGTASLPNGSVVLNIPSSADILVEDNLISLSSTGTPGTYSKITTDDKGRVVSGTALTESDIISILGYTPYHAGNDGPGSNLNADLLDNQHGSYYTDASNLTGVIDVNILPSSVEPGTYTKVAVDSNGLVTDVYYANQNDIIYSLGYTPVPDTGIKTVYDKTTFNGDVELNGEVSIYDHLPLLATDSPNVLPDTPRGISFIYGGLYSNKTGILAYYPADNELKLVTNVFASGSDIDGDGDSDYQDDINGGNAEAIYVLQNLDGDASTILLKHIADELYVNSSTDENINGLKTFLDGIVVKKQISITNPPGNTEGPLDVSDNTNKVINLNADLLDDEDGAFYTDAGNMTGAFSYENVTFDHIQGTNSYIPKFNDDVNDPANRIDDSSLKQDNNGNIVVDTDNNFSVGSGDLNNGINSLNVGNNRLNSESSAAIGSNNIASGNNSLALNQNSVTMAENSIAMGNYGITSLPNQLSVGAFSVNGEDNSRLEHGQYTITNMHLSGTSMGNIWTDLEPKFPLPKNKTIAYNAEILLTKAFGTGLAHFKMESGIYKNATFRDTNSIWNLLNLSTKPQASKKLELFNNSQIKNHYHTFSHSNGQAQLQDVRVIHPPLQYNQLTTENVEDYYFYDPVDKHVSGTYLKTNDGNLTLDIDKPLYDASFVMDTSSRGIKITSENHGVAAGSKIYINFQSFSGFPSIEDGYYDVYSVLNKDVFYVEQPYYTGYISYYSGINNDYANISLNRNSIQSIDSQYVSQSSGTLSSDGNTIYFSTLSNRNILDVLHVDSNIIIHSGDLLFNRTITGVFENRLALNDPIATGHQVGETYRVFNGPVNLYYTDYSFSSFLYSTKIYTDTDLDGSQIINTQEATDTTYQDREVFGGNISIPTDSVFYTTGNYLSSRYVNNNVSIADDYAHNTSIHINALSIPKRSTYPTGVPVIVRPLLENSGTAYIHHKTTESGSFIYQDTVFDTHDCVYIKDLNSNLITIYETGLQKPIELPYTPVRYSLVDGYLDDDNDIFEIVNNNDKYYLTTKYQLDYETKNIYKIRVKASDRSNRNSLEQNFTITVNDTRAPYSLANIPDMTFDITDGLDYTIPSNVFNEEDNEGSIILSASLQNGDLLPSWLSFDANTRNFIASPSGCDLGTHNIRVYANNNFSGIYQDFYLTVVDSQYQSLEYFDTNNPAITDIILPVLSIDENLPSGSTVSICNHVGSYDPYLSFTTASNSFSGIFTNNSDIVECVNQVFNYPAISITGSSDLLTIGSIIKTKASLGLSNSNYAKNVYAPFEMSGTPGLTDGRIHFADSYKNYDNTFFSGMIINVFGDDTLPRKFTIQEYNDYSVKVEERTVLVSETGLYELDVINTENNEDLVVHHSPFQPLWMSIERQGIEPTGVVQEQSLDKIFIADPFSTNVTWASGYPECDDRDLIQNTLVSFTPRSRDYNLEINTSGNLDNFNYPDQSGLKRSNIKYDLDTWNFRDEIDNPVLALYGAGSSEFCRILSENDDIINLENGDRLISTEQRHHGTRIEVSTTYELFDTYEVAKDNGKLMIDRFDSLIAENGEQIVHDYAIAARSGDACLLFPGTRQGDIVLTYEEDVDLLDNTFNYYYNWGKLIPFNFSSQKSFIRMLEIYNGNKASGLIRYDSDLPGDDNYSISGIKYDEYWTGDVIDCENIFGPETKGFESEEDNINTYVTGLVKVYSKAGTGIVNLDFDQDINLDSRDYNNLYLSRFESSESNKLPSIGQYKDSNIIDADSVEIYNLFLMPNSGQSFNGSFSANIDENHGYVEEFSTIINRVPVEFTNSRTTLSGINLNTQDKPKDYVFDILSINGNKISVKDNLNYLLKENGRPDYFEQTIEGEYLTNGIQFSGSLFDRHKNIYDVRHNLHNISSTYKNIPFFYDATSETFTFEINPQHIQAFDDIHISFASGQTFYISGIEILIDDNMINEITPIDLEPYKDSILLETSEIERTSELRSVKFSTKLRDLSNDNAIITQDVRGSCTISNSVINRLQDGFYLNYSGSPEFGYKINSFVGGFQFSGFIPKYNNVLSSTNLANLIDENHLGHASVVHSENLPLLSGARLIRYPNENEIGYNEYYFIGSHNNDLRPVDLTGVGSSDNPYVQILSAPYHDPEKDKYLEFIYLGEESNTARVTGILNVGSGTDILQIYQIGLSEQIKSIHDSSNYNINNSLVLVTGSTGINQIEHIDLSLSVNRFDKILINVSRTTGINFYGTNKFTLNTFVQNSVINKPFILESDTILNSGYDYYPHINPTPASLVYTPNPTLNSEGCLDCNTIIPQYIPSRDPDHSTFKDPYFNILPYIKTDTAHCTTGVLKYEKNKDIFFNGNIIQINNLATQKSFLEKDNEILFTTFNSSAISNTGIVSRYAHKYNSTDERYTISGVAINGQRIIPPIQGDFVHSGIFENQYRYNYHFGISHNEPLPSTGITEFIKTQSGQFNILDYNNIYYHTYGGTTSHYPLDTSGNLVPVCQTGTYSITSNIGSCASGTLCVKISGYKTNSFHSIPDISDRQNIGKQSNVITYGANSGSIKRFGVNKKMYFDFVDGFEEISNIYHIQDLVEPNVLSISMPYNASYIGKSGLVYIIDSDENIKSHLNPNLDNEFVISNGSMGGLTSLDKKIFNYFDNDSKRWKHTIHFDHGLPPLTSHNITLSNKAAKFIPINPDTISISGVEYSLDGNTFIPINNNSLDIPSNYNQITLKITTINGDQELFEQLKLSMPKISISGIGIYSFIYDEPDNYGYHGSGWNIGLLLNQPEYYYNNKDIVIRASDNTGKDDFELSISKKMKINIDAITNSYAATGDYWSLAFDVSNIDLDSSYIANLISFTISDTPDANSVNIAHIDDRSIVFTGYAGGSTGVYYPEFTITDLTTAPYTPLATGTGTLSILEHISSKPDYEVSLNNLQSTYYINLDNQDNILFDIPAELGPVQNEVLNSLNITFNHNSKYDILLYSSSYNYDTKRFEIIGKPTNSGNTLYLTDPGRYVNQSVSISLKQPVYDEYGNYTYQTYTNNFGFNTVFYKNIEFQHIDNPQDLVFNTDSPWSLEFYVLSGVGQYDPQERPNVTIFNTPNIGIHETSPLEYDLDYEYDNALNKWKVTASSKKNIYGKYVNETGIYPISIYIEDKTGFLNKYDYSIRYNPITLMKNIQSNVWTTPDNEFFTKADYYDLDENGSNSISFPGNLKEDSISFSTTIRKYDRDFNIWQNSYMSDPMIDRYDVRLNISNDNLTLQCRGIGKDKVIAVAKFETIEIESNEIEGPPLTITGVKDYGVPSGIIVQNPSGWTLDFKTIGGLAHPNYPPTILLEDMPTFCTGYNPLVDDQLQCLKEPPQWDPNDFGGSWSYSFSGIGSCTLLGKKDFKIIAIDTDPSLLPASPYLPETDDVDHFFTFLETIESGNPPNIVQNSGYVDSAVMKPYCNVQYRNQYDFGPGLGGVCIGPTGVKSYTISGSVPSGLSYSIFFPSEANDNTPSEPYSYLGSGYVRIEGYPATFATNEDKTYNEKLYINVIDARDLEANLEIVFTDVSEPFDPDVAIAVYFDKDQILLTPETGTKIIDENIYNYWQPAPIEQSLECNSIITINNCKAINSVYSGNIGLDTRVFFSQPEYTNLNDAIVVDDEIYIRFEDANNSDLDGVYIVESGSNGELYIHPDISLTIQNTGNATLVRGNRIDDSPIDNFDELFPPGNIVNSTTKCILGGGRIDYDENPGPNPIRRILGSLRPSHRATIDGLTPFLDDAIDVTGLAISSLNNGIDSIYSTAWSDCWQTGYLHISGIMVPPIHAEIIDAPPAQDYYFSYNGARFALATRLAFGETEIQRLLIGNERTGRSLKYRLTDMREDFIIQSGSVSAGQSFNTINLITTTGTVYKIEIEHEADTFPTFDLQSLPYSHNEYVWVHKGDNLSTIPDEDSFPPLVPVGFDSISVINDLDDSDPNGVVMDPIYGIALGGYIPTDAGIGVQIPYSHTGTPPVEWSTENYLPRISGIIQKILTKDPIDNISANYTFDFQVSEGKITINSQDYLEANDNIFVEFFDNDGSLRFSSGLTISEPADLEFENIDLGISSFSGKANISFGLEISEIDQINNQVVLSHDNLAYSTGTPVGLDKNNSISTELELLENPGEIYIASGTSGLMYIANTNTSDTTWHNIFSSGDLISLYENIDDNIKIMPYNTEYVTEGKYTFQITGRSNVRENEDLIYKVCTMDNPDMPIFDSGTYPNDYLTPKKFFKNYTLHINKPISIVTGTVIKNGNELSFSTLGGKRPIYQNTPDVQIAAGINDLSYCGFFRYSTDQILTDEYDSANDRLNIRLSLDPKYGIDWSSQASIRIRISDETGSDEYTYNY